MHHPPKPNDVLSGDFWPEPVRALTIQEIGGHVKIEAVGIQSHQFYPRIIGIKDLENVQILNETGIDFRGDGEAFFLITEAYRIRHAYQFDPLFAVNVSQVDSLPHQIEAVYHYILRSPRIRFLLADDPGAGKTIMTGLLLKELKYRGLIRRVLIVVPGHLKDQWMREMRERFGETFTVIDRNMMNATWGRNVWQEQSQAITSMDFAKQDDVMATLGEVHWDLIVVDEAHKMAAYRYGEKTNRTERYRCGELFSRITDFLLFLTATPHRGDPENFRLFLNLLQPDLFANTQILLESIQNQDHTIFLRRLKEDLRDFNGRPLFPPRHIVTNSFRLSDDEKRLYNAVTDYVEKSYNKALSNEKRNVAFALLILQRRLASSVRAVRRSLERRQAKLSELLKLGKWLAERGKLDEDEFEDSPEVDRLREEEDLVERLTAAETREELQIEINTLGELIRLAREAERHEVEAKLNELRKVITDQHIQQTGEKLLIFTESRETLDYLSEKLKTWGFKIINLHGGMNLDARIRAEHDFRESAQVMISTEAGGEGINLQFCSLMVNYDIPWAPNRLEQRMGRIHRYGQQKEVFIYNLVASDTREGKVLEALFIKLNRIKEALGSDRVFDVIGEVLPGHSLKDLIVEAIANRRTLEEIVGEIEAVPDTEAVSRAREAALEALATRHIDLQAVLGEERRAKENRLVPEYIERFFQRASKVADVKMERRQDDLWRVTSIPYEIRNVSHDFKCQFGEVFRDYTKVAFDKQIARTKEAVFVAPGHPLLEAVINHLMVKCSEDLRRGAVFIDPDGRLDGRLWFLEGEIRDGANQIAGKRVFVLYQPEIGDLQLANVSILWDLKSGTPETGDTPILDENPVIAFAIENVLTSYRAELIELRERSANIKRKYGLRSLEQLLLESGAKLIDYETRRAQGEKIPEVEFQNEERRREELKSRRQTLEDEIRREVSLLPSAPKILGVVQVLPQKATGRTLRYDQEAEAIAMRVAMEYENSQERNPIDVSAQNLGYDICSTSAEGAIRYIEVKGFTTTGPVGLTPNEWMKAQRFRDEYWLYAVENTKTEPLLHTIQDLATKLKPEEVVDIVRYVVRDWKKATEETTAN